MGLIGTNEIVRDVPYEKGEAFTFRLLTGPEMDQAQEAEQRRQMRLLKDMSPDLVDRIINRGGKGTATLTDDQREMLSERGIDPQVVEECVRKEDRKEAFDKDVLIGFGLVGWSYDDECTPENRGRLDAVTRAWAASEIVTMNTRSAGEGRASVESSPLAESPQD